jgi:hypothetical protein
VKNKLCYSFLLVLLFFIATKDRDMSRPWLTHVASDNKNWWFSFFNLYYFRRFSRDRLTRLDLPENVMVDKT